MNARERIDAFVLAAGVFALYAATAPRGVLMEDDGGFVLASYFGGIAHPPGYPLYTLLGGVFAELPFGSVAWRVHLLSAACGALACALLWCCARQLGLGRLPAALAGLVLALAPAFWSQAVIADVYTLNAAFFLGLALLSLRGASLPLIAFVAGLSLSNHWPLMALVAPGIAALLWPRREEALRRSPVMALAFAAGLLPYAWLLWRSQQPLAISFAGPLGSLQEAWFFFSRAGYAQVDASATAGWLDRLRFVRFFGTELLLQLGIVGIVPAVLGFAAQWRDWGRRAAAALTAAFALPSLGLVALLGFDYDAFHRHVFHVYPLPAYAVAALWCALGVSRMRRAVGVAVAGAVLVPVAAAGVYFNGEPGDAWVERYARTMLEAFPPDAVVILKGADVGPLAYHHMIGGVRPDLTLYHAQGLVLGNRLFHPYRADRQAQEQALAALVQGSAVPVYTTAPPVERLPYRETWLFAAYGPALEAPAALERFYEEALRDARSRNGFIAFYQGELRRRYAAFAARSGDAALARLPGDFETSLGALEGLLARENGFPLRTAARLLESAAQRMPSDASKRQQARFFELRAYVRLAAGDRRGAAGDLESALALWPSPANGAGAALKRIQAP